MLVGSIAAPVVGSLLADDNGAEGANNAAAAQKPNAYWF